MDNRFVIIEKRNLPVIWIDERRPNIYHRIRRFDCRVVSLENEFGGTYFTVIPISPAEYRRCNKTKACVKIKQEKSYVTFVICDDWGTIFQMDIPKTMKKEIRIATKAAIDAKLI